MRRKVNIVQIKNRNYRDSFDKLPHPPYWNL